MQYSRRESIKLLGLSSLGIMGKFSCLSLFQSKKMLARKIPSSAEELPVVGLGTWQTFDVGNSEEDRKVLAEVLHQMYLHGGKMIDSSPMYGSSEQVVGDLTSVTDFNDALFYATKVWTSGKQSGIEQMESSCRKMNREVMDLIQIHNLMDWQTHVKTLKKWKEEGKIRYWGITHYLDSAHDRLAQVIRTEQPDFVQFNYSIRSRHAEKSLFDTVEKHNVAVIINRPYEGGSLFKMVKGKALPEWCAEYDIHSWGQYFLKFILSNPRVNCVIPGTSKPHHLIDNMQAGFGKMPDEEGREKMYRHINN